MVNGFFPEDKISEIRERASILEVVSDYVNLKKAGKNYRGLCPFHSEKTPSFMVNEEKQIFHCFGCGEGGDVFTFLMKIGPFTFPQAVEELAKRYGVNLTRREVSKAHKEDLEKRELLFQINKIASEYYHQILTQKKEGEKGRKYLAQRGITPEIIENYRIGYAIEGWNGLVNYLWQKKISLEQACQLGLILARKKVEGTLNKEAWYDVFRNRIIFPIFDLHERVVGFGGRLIGEGEPKYINSSESKIYHKGEILYGLHVAKRYISEKDCVIIVEGYFDLLTLHKFGLKNSVATLGTALTPKHIHLLKRYTKNVILLFDPDQAGVQAALRTLPLFLEEGLGPKVISLPKGEDPDTFIRKGNVGTFEKMLAQALPLMDFYLEGLFKTYDFKSIDGKVKIVEEGMKVIRKIPEKIRRDFYIKALSEKLDLKESTLYEILSSLPKDRNKTSTPLPLPSWTEPFPKVEEMVIRLMVHHPELIPRVAKEGIFQEFENPLLKRLGLTLAELFQKKESLDIAEVLSSVEKEISFRLRQFVFEEIGIQREHLEKTLRDCIHRIQQRKLKREGRELRKRIEEMEKKREGKELDILLTRRQEMAKREKGLPEGHPSLKE
ncbi:MAG: DNA primase [Thermodesulfobacteriota bacterium]